MKKKLKAEIRAKTGAELKEELRKREGEFSKTALEVKMGKIKNTSWLKHKADEIAVIKTIVREKYLVEENK